MQYTENYSLRKPQMAETASVSDLNYNSDRIDAILADDRQISVAMYVSGNTYNTGDLVGYENPSTHHIRVYRCLVDNVTGTWDSTKWTQTNLADEILDAKASGGTEVEANPTGTPSDTMHTVRIDDVIYAVGGDSANQNIADAFSELQTYAVGDYCIYESILYKCTTAVETAGAWDSTKWTSCVVTDEMGSGGGGGSSTFAGLSDVSFTNLTDDDFAQYDATAQKWKNVAITGVSVQPVIYSTEEREVGVWTGGKPLYQKTIIYSTPFTITNGSWYTSSETYEGLNLINGEVLNNAYGYYPGVIIVFENNHLVIGNQTKDQPITNIKFVTLQYTKTTDTPGSGTWTPSGVPAVHYSTDEQVVGTWIDGSTMYEKTITTQLIAGSAQTVQNNISNVDKIVYVNGRIIDANGINLIPQGFMSSVPAYSWILYDVGRTYFRYNASSYLSGTVYVTLRYTKSS